MRGYFEIGIYNSKTIQNLGTLWRSAYQLGASGIFTICHRYTHQYSDVWKTTRHIPYRHFECFDMFYEALPYDAQLVGIEMGGVPLYKASHPKQAIYLLGAEDNGLPSNIIDCCHHVISIETIRMDSFNVAVAGSIVMYQRMVSTFAPLCE